MTDIKVLKIKFFEPFFWIYFVWYYFPIARTFFRSGTYNLIFFGFFALGCFFCLAETIFKQQKFQLKFSPLVPVLLYMAIFTSLVVLGISDASEHIRISFSFWGSLLVFYFTSVYEAAQKRLVSLMLVLFMITMVTSVGGVISNPSAARILTFADNNIEEDLVLRMFNIAGIAFFQGLVICVPILVSFILNRKYRVFSYVMLFCIFIGLVSASFTISIMMFFVALALGYLFNKASWKRITLVIFSLILVFIIPWGDLVLAISQNIGNDIVATRFRSIATSIASSSASGNLASRLETYWVSINTFLEHPLGIGPEYSHITFHNGIGYHSQIFDDIARYGVFAIVFYVIFSVSFFKLLKKQWGKIGFEQVAFPVTVVYILFLLLNPGFTSAHESVLVLFIIPGLPELLLSYQRQLHPKT